MGYSTAYELTVQPLERGDEIEAFVQVWKGKGEDHPKFSAYEFTDALEYGPPGYWGTVDNVKWYDHDIAVSWLSEQFPDVLFILSGNGEDSPDLWTAYFKNGKVQHAAATITYDLFDEEKLGVVVGG